MRRALIAAVCLALALATAVSCTRVVDLDRPDAQGSDAAGILPDGRQDGGGLGDGGDLGDGGSNPDGAIGDASLPDAF